MVSAARRRWEEIHRDADRDMLLGQGRGFASRRRGIATLTSTDVLCRCRNSLLRGDAEDSGGFARRGGRQENNCAEASGACADRLHGCDVDFSRGELREQVGGCAATVFALHEERGLLLAELEFGLLRRGHKRGGIFGNEDEFGFRGGALISPKREQVHARVTQYSQYARSFANLVGNAQ